MLSITRFKLFSSILAEYYRYKYTVSHLDFYTDIGNILSKIELSVTDDPITHTVKKNWLNFIRVLLDQLCIDQQLYRYIYVYV